MTRVLHEASASEHLVRAEGRVQFGQLIRAQQRSTEHEINPFRAWMGRKRGQFKAAGTLDLVRNAAAMVAASGELVLTFESTSGYTDDELVFRPLSPALKAGSFVAWKRGRIFSDAGGIISQGILHGPA